MIKIGNLFQVCAVFVVTSYICGKMVSTPHQCPGVRGKVCNHFLHAKDNDSRRPMLCTNCCGKS